MEAKLKITRVKVALQSENPFFAYLIMGMRFIENKDISSMGISNIGVCYYNQKFIDKLSEIELKGVLAHEVLHLVLQHLERSVDLNNELYNISADLCVNDILKTNDFTLPCGLIPNYNHEYIIETNNGEEYQIINIDKKTAEDIYNELKNFIKDNIKSISFISKERFDKHIKESGENETEEEKNERQRNLKKTISEASAYARQKGKIPEGLELFIDNLLNEKVNWKYLLYKYLTKTIPFDYSYSRPSKRSFSVGVYMPIMKRDNIEIVVSLDTSGSISNSELTEFMTEINGIAKSFNNLTMKLIICDSEIKNVYTIGNGDSEEISQLKITGGGGTSHKPIYDYIKNELPNTRLLVNFTDGYTDLDELDNSVNTLWVICKNGVDENKIPFGEVIKLN